MSGRPIPTSHLFDQLRSLELPTGHFAVFGSGPLIARGIVEATNDLDVICRGPAWQTVAAMAEVDEFEDGTPRVALFDGLLTFGITWRYGHFDVGELIDSAEVLAGLPFVRLEHVEAYKLAAGRAKDLDHLRRLDAWRASHRSG